MPRPFKTRLRRLMLVAAALFCVLFIFRIVYGYLNSGNADGEMYDSRYFDNIEGLRKNYASEKILMQKSDIAVNNNANAPAFSSSLMYEKTAAVSAKSSNFDHDNAHLRARIDSFKAIIQYEKALGEKGHREVHLLIGVKPESFDAFYKDMERIGNNHNIVVTKVDKTNEYQQLNARKASLEKSLQSLEELKARQGAISDMVTLQDKLLEIQEHLQDLGVDLGNFDQENQFCTVRFSLYEGAPAKKITLIYRVKVALEWTLHAYLWLVLGILLAVCAAFIVLLTIEKFNLLSRIVKRFEE